MFELLNLNLRFGLAGDRGERSWTRRKTALPALFAASNADFLCFQEVNDFQEADLAALLPDHRRIGRREPAPAFWQNNLIFYRKDWRCIRRDRFFLSPTPDLPSRFRDSRWPRQCTLGLFEKRGERVICATTHFDFRPGTQLRSAGVLLDRLAVFAGSPSEIPAVLAGDFNATPFSPAHDRFTRQGGFRNAFSPPFPGTFHGFTGKAGGEHIDWVLHRGDLGVAEARIETRAEDGPFPSDHFPLRVAFRRGRRFISRVSSSG
jgi:endonuclease/exonuclease/phosphatase family metal-dependent hydrolase